MKQPKVFKDFQAFFASTSGLREIIEITYAYEHIGDEQWYNTTLFEQFAGLKLLDQFGSIEANNALIEENDPETILGKVDRRCVDVIDRLASFRDECEGVGGVAIIVAHYCDYAIDMLSIARSGLIFELQKAGWNPKLPESKNEELMKTIKRLERKRFGKEAHEDLFESVRVVQILEELFEKYRDNLSDDDQDSLLGYIETIKDQSAYKDIAIFEEEEYISYRNQEFFEQEIPRDCYVAIFQKVFALYGIDKYVTIDSRSSIYDGLGGLHIPSSDSYETLSLWRLLELIVHEIEVHYLVQKNMETILPLTDGANSLFKEEGLAKIMEEGLTGKTIDTFDITPGMLEILPGEIFEGDDYKDFLLLYNRLKSQEQKTYGKFLRKKRNYPLSIQGVQHKDITYTRGKFQIRTYLIEGGSFASLFYGKLDFPDIQILEKTLSPSVKKSMVFPKFVAEKILWTCLNNFDKAEQIHNTQAFTDYLIEKYPYIDFTKVPSVALSKHQETLFDELTTLVYDALPVKHCIIDQE